MATFSQLQAQRKSALREFRRRQRAADTAVERIERRISVLLRRKTLIDRETALSLDPPWADFFAKVREMEQALADFVTVSTI